MEQQKIIVDSKPRIHVIKLDTNKSIFGSLNIGRLTKTKQIAENGLPIYLMDNGTAVTCNKEMLARINQRLDFLNWGR